MRAQEFILEAEQTADDLIQLDSDDIKPWVISAFNQIYPGVELYFEDDDYVYISTNEDAAQASAWGTTDDDEYYLAIGVGVEDRGYYIVVGNATAGNYKGVTTAIFKNIFDGMTAKYGKKELTLSIQNDSSGGTWKQIANKLGAEYENAQWEQIL